MNLSECEKKKKRSLTAICTLGLSTAPISKLWGSSDVAKGTSFTQGEGGAIIGFAFKLVFFLLILLPWMAIAFIYHIFSYFYLSNFEKKLRNSSNSILLIQQIRFSNRIALENAIKRISNEIGESRENGWDYEYPHNEILLDGSCRKISEIRQICKTLGGKEVYEPDLYS
jgi:hypothetical protein